MLTACGRAAVRPGMSQAQFLNQLKHERIVELSGEGWRWADLARWGDLSPALQARDPEFRNYVVGKHGGTRSRWVTLTSTRTWRRTRTTRNLFEVPIIL